MSVFILGMEMPQNCIMCPFWTEWGNCFLTGDWKFQEDFPLSQMRMPSCPLVEIKTPHGELIERKSAKVRFCQHCHWKESIENACDICAACPIDLIPTIIEAEGGGEE